MVREFELHQHGPDNKIINEVLPNISTIVTVDPYWAWTAKYSDYVLPACNYWEKWDFLDRSPWVFFKVARGDAGRRGKSDVEIMSLLAAWVGLGDLWSKTDENTIAQLRERGRISTTDRGRKRTPRRPC